MNLHKSIKIEQERLQKLTKILEMGQAVNNPEFNTKIELNIRATKAKLQVLHQSSDWR